MSSKLYSITLVLASLSLTPSCITTPDSLEFYGEQIPTIPVTSGCKGMGLDQDCGGASGPKAKIDVGEYKLRLAGGEAGQVVYVQYRNLAGNSFGLRNGARMIIDYLDSLGAEVLEKKAIGIGEDFFGIWMRFDREVYANVKEHYTTRHDN